MIGKNTKRTCHWVHQNAEKSCGFRIVLIRVRFPVNIFLFFGALYVWTARALARVVSLVWQSLTATAAVTMPKETSTCITLNYGNCFVFNIYERLPLLFVCHFSGVYKAVRTKPNAFRVSKCGRNLSFTLWVNLMYFQRIVTFLHTDNNVFEQNEAIEREMLISKSIWLTYYCVLFIILSVCMCLFSCSGRNLNGSTCHMPSIHNHKYGRLA